MLVRQASKSWLLKIEDTMYGETKHQEPRTATGVTSELVPAVVGIATTGMTGPGTLIPRSSARAGRHA